MTATRRITIRFRRNFPLTGVSSPTRFIDSDDTEYVMRRIRENYNSGASGTFVLCGSDTPERKYVDWEIKATLDDRHGPVGRRSAHGSASDRRSGVIRQNASRSETRDPETDNAPDRQSRVHHDGRHESNTPWHQDNSGIQQHQYYRSIVDQQGGNQPRGRSALNFVSSQPACCADRQQRGATDATPDRAGVRYER